MRTVAVSVTLLAERIQESFDVILNVARHLLIKPRVYPLLETFLLLYMMTGFLFLESPGL